MKLLLGESSIYLITCLLDRSLVSKIRWLLPYNQDNEKHVKTLSFIVGDGSFMWPEIIDFFPLSSKVAPEDILSNQLHLQQGRKTWLPN